jgi:hypothetical protein
MKTHIEIIGIITENYILMNIVGEQTRLMAMELIIVLYATQYMTE